MLNVNCYGYDEHTNSYVLEIEHNADVIILRSEGVFEGCDLQLKYDCERKGWSVLQRRVVGDGSDKAPLKAGEWVESVFLQEHAKE